MPHPHPVQSRVPAELFHCTIMYRRPFQLHRRMIRASNGAAAVLRAMMAPVSGLPLLPLQLEANRRNRKLENVGCQR